LGSVLTLAACASGPPTASPSSSTPSESTPTTAIEQAATPATALASVEGICSTAGAELASIAPVGDTRGSAESTIAALHRLVDTTGPQLAAIGWGRDNAATADQIAAQVGELDTDLAEAARRAATNDVPGAAVSVDDARDHVNHIVSILRHAGAICGAPAQPSRSGTHAPVDVIGIGGYTAQVTAHGTDVWVAVQDAQSVVRVDGRTNQIVARVAVDDDDLRTIQVTDGGVWVRGASAMHRIDPHTNRVVQDLPKRAIGESVTRAFVDDEAIWACNGTTVVRGSTTDGHPIATISLPYRCGAVSSGEGQVWATSDSGEAGRLTRIDATTNTSLFTVPIAADAPTFAAIGPDQVWTNSEAVGAPHTASVGVDAATGDTVATTKLTSGGGSGALASGTYYAVDTAVGFVVAINARTGEITRTFDAGAQPNALAVNDNTMWVVDEATGRLLRFDLNRG
jgi:hypothetical protein